jgi:hypothetical protein
MSGLPHPSAILFDIGDTLLEERRFDLEAGLGAVVPDAAYSRPSSKCTDWHRTSNSFFRALI